MPYYDKSYAGVDVTCRRWKDTLAMFQRPQGELGRMRKGGVRSAAPAYPGFAWAMNAEDVAVGEAEVSTTSVMSETGF